MKKIIPAGTKIHIALGTGYCGMDENLNYILAADYTEEELDNTVWMMAIDHAASYGYYNINDYDEEDLPPEDSDETNYYVDSIEGWWEYYEEDKHAGYHYSAKTPFIEL